jgi:hypothetical protein
MIQHGFDPIVARAKRLDGAREQSTDLVETPQHHPGPEWQAECRDQFGEGLGLGEIQVSALQKRKDPHAAGLNNVCGDNFQE